MNASSAMPGMVCSTPTARTVPSAAPARARPSSTPSGTATAAAASSEIATSSRCRTVSRASAVRRSHRYAPSPPPRAAGRASARSAAPTSPSVAQRIRRHARHRLPIHLHAPVERPHRRHVQPPAQPRELRHGVRAVALQAGAHQRGGLVRRKEAAVVLQHHQPVAVDQPVRGVAVDHVHRALRQRAGTSPPAPADALSAGAVRTRRCSPGSPSSRPMKSGVNPARSRGDARARSDSVRSPSRSAVSRRTAMAYVFSKPSGGSQRTPQRAANSRDTRPNTAAGSGLRRLAQDGEQSGARVLGIDVDRPRPQRAERDLRRAQPHPPLHRDPARLQQLREHLRQQVRLRERLGRDHHRPLRRRAPIHGRRGGETEQAQNARRIRRIIPPPIASGRRGRATYSVSGARTSVSAEATCSMRPRRSTAMRSASSAASCRSCVTSTAVIPSSRRSAANASCRSARVMASSAPNGSSSSTMPGPRRQRPRDRHALPLPARQLARPAPAELRRVQPHPRQRRRALSPPRPPRRAARARARRCAAPSSAAAARRPAPRSRSAAAARPHPPPPRPSHRPSRGPPSGSVMRLKQRSSVVFPDPLSPTSATHSPAAAASDTPSSAATAP